MAAERKLPSATREPGTLRIGEPLRRRIARLRHLDPRRGPTTLDVAKVREIESTLDCVLDDEILALFASGTEDLNHDAGLDLSRVIERTRIAESRNCPTELLAIGGHPGGLEFYCVKRRRGPEDPMLLVEYATGDNSLVGRPLVEWVETRLEIRREVLANGDEDEKRLAPKLPSVAEIGQFQPSLVEVVASAGPKVRRVRHPTFGVGEVLSEVAAGDAKKLNVRFASGTKLLIDRVLEDVE